MLGVLCAALALGTLAGGCGAASSAGSSAVGSDIMPIADIRAAAANPVTVSPLPGTEDASPTTQISFLGQPGGNPGGRT